MDPSNRYSVSQASGRPASLSRGGFTLIELLVVISIIALLVAILVPTLAKAKELSRRAICQVRMRNWGSALHMYAQDYKALLPSEGFKDGDKSSAPIGAWDDPGLWVNAVPPYVRGRSYYQIQQDDIAGRSRMPRDGDNSDFVCPTAGPAEAGTGDTVQDGYYMMWGCQEGTKPPWSMSQKDQRKVYWCYVWNSGINNTNNVTNVPLDTVPTWSTAPLLVEKMMSPNEVSPPSMDDLCRCKTNVTRFAARHNGGGNLLFFDGHVGYFLNSYATVPDAGGHFNKPDIQWDPFGTF